MNHPSNRNIPGKPNSLPKGYIFNGILFLIFVLPIWDIATFQLGPVITDLREVCLVILPAVYFFYPSRKSSLSLQTKYWIIAFFILLIATELIKKMYYEISLFDTVKNFRVTLPVLSGLLICLQGRKIDPEFTVKTVLSALLISFILTPLMVIVGMEPATFNMEGKELQISYMRNGRFANDNFEFSLLGIALLFYIPKIRMRKKRFKKLILVTSILSILMLILSFNRTMMAAGFLLGLILLLTNLNKKTLTYVFLTAVFAGSIAGYFYTTNPNIQRQVDRRILTVLQEEGALAESVYYGNRDKLYAIFLDKLEDNWILGLPGGVSLIDNENTISSKSDISFYNVWIRHGLTAMLIFMIILALIYADQRRKMDWMPDFSLGHQVAKAVVVTFPFYVIVSLNIDSLVAHNAVLFLLLLINFYDLED